MTILGRYKLGFAKITVANSAQNVSPDCRSL